MLLEKIFNQQRKIIMLKYHNDLNLVAFRHFGAREQDLFLAICKFMNDQGEGKIQIPFKVIKDLSNTSFATESLFVQYLEEVNKKFMKFTCRFVTNKRIVNFVLFPTFIIEKEEKVLEVSVNRDFSYILNDLTSNFTMLELRELSSLESVYSKNMFRLLKQYKSTGYYKVSVEEFRRLLDVPESYDFRKINANIVKKHIMAELPKYFENLNVTQIKDGRIIVELEFRFEPQTKSENDVVELIGSDYIAAQMYDKRIEIGKKELCPDCGQELKQIKDKNGDVFYGHKNYKNGSCCSTFSSLEQIEKRREELEEIREKELLEQKILEVVKSSELLEFEYKVKDKLLIIVDGEAHLYSVSKKTLEELKGVVRKQK